MPGPIDHRCRSETRYPLALDSSQHRFRISSGPSWSSSTRLAVPHQANRPARHPAPYPPPPSAGSIQVRPSIFRPGAPRSPAQKSAHPPGRANRPSANYDRCVRDAGDLAPRLVIVIVSLIQYPHAKHIHRQPDNSNRNRLVEGDRHRVEEAVMLSQPMAMANIARITALV